MVLNPTYPVEPVTNILILPAPSEMKMLQFAASNPAAVAEPMITLFAPVVMQHPAPLPIAVLRVPVLANSDPYPTAVLQVPEMLPNKAAPPTDEFWDPMVLLASEHLPTAVLQFPVVFNIKEANPKAVLEVPIVLLLNEHTPTAVLLLPVVLHVKAL